VLSGNWLTDRANLVYPFKDRLRAARLYIKLGMRVGLTIRKLGCPTKYALKTWFREYEHRADLSNGRCIAATIRLLGYPSRSPLTA